LAFKTGKSKLIVIHHNPDCGTSRNTLEMIRASGVEPVIIEYLKTGWTKPYLQTLFAASDMSPKQAMRVSGTPAESLGLTAQDISDDQILDAMIVHPVLVNRPFVVSRKGIRLCRPSELVFELLDNPPMVFTKEDGEQVSKP
jgi:arsenate reductase (glutaredoxin)